MKNVIIYCFRCDSEILIRHNFLNRSDVYECLRELLQKEYDHFMERNKHGLKSYTRPRLSTIKELEVDGVMTQMITVYVPG